MHIQRACYYLKGKHILKDTKTFTSNRRISIPTALTESLKEYKVWYDDTKSKLGNLWSKSNKLVLTDEGNSVNANNLFKWLCAGLRMCVRFRKPACPSTEDMRSIWEETETQ